MKISAVRNSNDGQMSALSGEIARFHPFTYRRNFHGVHLLTNSPQLIRVELGRSKAKWSVAENSRLTIQAELSAWEELSTKSKELLRDSFLSHGRAVSGIGYDFRGCVTFDGCTDYCHGYLEMNIGDNCIKCHISDREYIDTGFWFDVPIDFFPRVYKAFVAQNKNFSRSN